MRARDILSKNVRALLEDAKETRAQVGTIKNVAAKSQEIGGALTNGTVGRMATGETPVNIDAIGDLAAVFGLKPWQLLVENLNPKALPQLADPAFLSQMKQIVDSAQSSAREVFPSTTDEQQVQSMTAQASRKVGPALTKAFGGKNDNARGSTAEVPKPRSGRGGKGAAGTRRGG